MPEKQSSRPELLRVLGPLSATAVVVGSVIGSGIFYKANVIASSVGRFDLVLLAWIVGGVMSLLGALALAELAAMLPHAGGQYVYLREAYGPLTGFLWGWGEFWIMRTASTAALAVAFARALFQSIYPWLETVDMARVSEDSSGVWITIGSTTIQLIWIHRLLAITAIMALALVNILGSRWGGAMQNVTTCAKIGVLVALMVLPFLTGHASTTNLSSTYSKVTDGSLLAGFGAALTAVFWAYDGWNNVAMVGEEIREPQRNIPRALISGMLILIGLYLGATVAYHLVLSMSELAETPKSSFAAAEACTKMLGGYGAAVASAAVMLSTFGALNSNILTGPRVLFAMARDRLFPQSLARVNPRFRSPDMAILAQVCWAVVLIIGSNWLTRVQVPDWIASLPLWLSAPLTQSITGMADKQIFDVLTDLVIFGQFTFFILSVAAVFVLRVRRPDLERPYRTIGYPILPALFLVSATGFLISMLLTSPIESLVGLTFIGLGLVAYQFIKNKAS